MISKLNVTSIKVRDQDEALFYVIKLGLEVAQPSIVAERRTVSGAFATISGGATAGVLGGSEDV